MNTMRHLLLQAFLGCVLVCAGETRAVIVSGGRSKMFNHERYWNDCAFLYRTLRQECHLAKDHVTLLMADGDAPAADMLRDGAWGFASSATDLDGDGEPDLSLAATRQNLDEVFRSLSLTLTPADRLFVFITDHGERDADGNVRLWLWDGQSLTPRELADLLGQCRPATMSVLLGQCYAGAFAQELQGEGRVITAACSASQMSWASKERPYDEFVYHWTCAVAQHDERGAPVGSDQDGDGHVTMQEAFDYARQHDSRPETPSLDAQPAELARQWAFSATPTAISPLQSPAAVRPVYDLQGRKR